MKIFNIEPDGLYTTLKHFQKSGCGNQYFSDLNYNGRTVTLNNKKVVNFANCCYLGIEKHPELINGAIEAVKRYGSQNSFTRALASSPLYHELETNIRRIFPGNPVVYSSTTLAHYSALPLLAKENDAIILDAYVHNSVRTASMLCKANGTMVVLSKHNDMEFLKYLIKRLKKEGYRNIWYCADGIYSIYGNGCNIPALHQLLNEEDNFYAYIDDAHGIGWTGKNGMGYIMGNYGLHKKMIVIGSFSKSVGCGGAFITTHDEDLADYLKLSSQTYIFTIPMSPSILGALNASLNLHLSDEISQYQSELLEKIEYFKTVCEQLSVPITKKENTPIFMIKIGEDAHILNKQNKLTEKGFFASTAIFPAVNKGEGGIRISISRHITKEDIECLLESISKLLQTSPMPEMIVQ